MIHCFIVQCTLFLDKTHKILICKMKFIYASEYCNMVSAMNDICVVCIDFAHGACIISSEIFEFDLNTMYGIHVKIGNQIIAIHTRW